MLCILKKSTYVSLPSFANEVHVHEYMYYVLPSILNESGRGGSLPLSLFYSPKETFFPQNTERRRGKLSQLTDRWRLKPLGPLHINLNFFESRAPQMKKDIEDYTNPIAT